MGRPDWTTIGTSLFGALSMIFLLAVWTNPPVFLWVLSFVGIAAHGWQILTEFRKVKRVQSPPSDWVRPVTTVTGVGLPRRQVE